MSISIITIVKNDVLNIKNTILSVINQNYKDFEYIVIDGNSTDGTYEIISEFSNKIDFFISEKDNGIYDAINKGISYATKNLIGIIHSGDLLIDNSLTKIYELSKYYPNSIIYGDIYYTESIFNHNYKKLYIANHKFLKKEMTIFHPSTFIPQQIYQKYGKYDTKYKSASDYDFLLKLFLQNVNFIYLNIPLTIFSKGGLSTQNISLTLAENYYIRKSQISIYNALCYFLKTSFIRIIYRLRNTIFIYIFGIQFYNKLKINKYSKNND